MSDHAVLHILVFLVFINTWWTFLILRDVGKK